MYPHVCVCVGLFFPGYIGEFEIVDDHRAGKIVVEVRNIPRIYRSCRLCR